MLEREPDMSVEMDEPTIVATCENRAQIIEIMSSARTMIQEFQDLWNSSGGTGRLSQENTDRLFELLREIGSLTEEAALACGDIMGLLPVEGVECR
ncbi:hypothetical protein, partial [Rhizobium leguminosarum]|uniref:hypothetical protein n=1 Tax=Rhizobium leguminosarum TaxID=384 RepID=UPI003F95965A